MYRFRPFLFVSLCAAILIGGCILWLQVGLLTAAASLGFGARSYQTSLIGAVDNLSAGEYETALSNYNEVEVAANRVTLSAHSPQMDLMHRISGISTAIDNWRILALATGDITASTGELLSVFGELSGQGGGAKIFSDGSINIELLRKFPDRVSAIDVGVERSVASVRALKLTGPAAGLLAKAQTKALTEVIPVQKAIASLVKLAPLLPDALGANEPKSYLIAIGNQAEMRASGGAPLTLVLVEFNNGRISIPIKGQTSTQLFPPMNAPITWWGPARNPFFPSNPRFSPMVVANTHPSLLYSAREMAGAWVGGGYPKVDGVVTLDLSAIAAVLNAIGPIESPTYGPVTGEKLGELLLVDAYAKFGQSEAETRQIANQQLLDDLLTRILSGEDLVSSAKAIASNAPGRHFQVWMSDTRFEQFAIESGAGGNVTDPGTGDWSAVYTQNGNQSKVDVFQKRNVVVSARLNADGSAHISQQMIVANATPVSRPEGPPERIGYETSWLKAAYIMYVPDSAVNFRAFYAQGFTVRSFKGHRQYGRGFSDDGFGNKLIRVVGWTPPGGQATVSVSYDLPVGTFTTKDAGLSYTLQAEPQSLWIDSTVTVRVTPPVGWAPIAEVGMSTNGGVAEISAIQSGPVQVTINMERVLK